MNRPSPNLAVLVRALTTDPPEVGVEDVPHLLLAGLGGEVRARLPEGHPLRPLLRSGQLKLGTRHAAIRSEVRSLLAVWAREGIPALLFKGFALAEFEYFTPGERLYGDVDVLIPEDLATVTRAVHLAIAHGWRSDGQHASPEYWTHESAHLFSPGGQVRLDVHRFVVGWIAGPQQRVRALTQGVWNRAQRTDWEGVPVWRPDPHDALVVNVALGRQWGGDAGHLKPADYSDTRVLMARHGLTWEDLSAHAQAVGGSHTWVAFRQVCDPSRRLFALNEPLEQQLLQAVQRDGHRRKRSRHWHLLPRRLRRLTWVPRLLPHAAAAWWAVRAGGDPRQHLSRWTPRSSARTLPLGEREDVIVALRWITRLLYPRQSRTGTCVPRAYATYRALRRYGSQAVFVSGVARTPQGVLGHAWIETPHGMLDAYGEPLNRLRYREVFHFPE